MGNIYIDSYEKIISSSALLKQRNIHKIDECNDCPYAIFCGGGGCGGLIYNYENEINAKSLYCEYYKKMIEFFIEFAIENTTSEIFING